MRYLIVLGDGMADYLKGPLGQSTPLEMAYKPNIDYLASRGMTGLIQTIPHGMKPASDVANLSVLGYDPAVYYSGRSPLEALAMGVIMEETDIALRANLVTLSQAQTFEDKIMLDYSADEIPTHQAKLLIDAIKREMQNDRFNFYAGVSYRHCLIDKQGGGKDVAFTPPHDISDKKIGEYLPKGEGAQAFIDLIKKSQKILETHPVNINRAKEGKNKANALWFWGAGTKPKLIPFYEKYQLKGAIISAVDLLKGIAAGADMEAPTVQGATGNIDTNFQGKAQAVIDAFERGLDFAYLHIEAPDECGHRGQAQAKIKAIEKIDEVVGMLVDYLNKAGEDYVIAVLCDHATPLCLRTHVSDPVPYIIYNPRKETISDTKYTEKDAQKGEFLPKGQMLIEKMLEMSR